MSNIVRVFRVQVPHDLKDEFEPLFQTQSLALIQNADGILNVTMGKPTQWGPDEYVMISVWKDIDHLIKFAGPMWNMAHIPDGMERFAKNCWVHHYETFD
jgi:quinol monooxygenase YgiN